MKKLMLLVFVLLMVGVGCYYSDVAHHNTKSNCTHMCLTLFILDHNVCKGDVVCQKAEIAACISCLETCALMP